MDGSSRSMGSNIDKFIAETNKEIKKLQDKQVSEAKKIVLGAYSMLVNGSAVDTGLYKSSHIISYNSKDNTVPTDVDNARINENKSVINKAKFNNNDTITIQNRLLYADRLEASPQHSKQQEPALYGRTEQLTKRLIAKRIKI